MIKYYTHTMHLVRAESEFQIKKGESAFVIETYNSFVVIVPKNEYTELIEGHKFNRIDKKGLIQEIWNILKDRINESGGILSFEEVYSIFQRSPIQDIINKRDIKKAMKDTSATYDYIKDSGVRYVALKPVLLSKDRTKLLNYIKNNNRKFVTVDIIQKDFNWSDLRIERILVYLEKEGRVRVDSNYRSGTKYYFINLNGN